MPALLLALGSLLLQVVGSMAGRALVALGIATITYTGMNSSLTWLKTQAVTALSSNGADVVQMLGVLKVGECISIVFSAMLARVIINGVQSDTFKRWVHK